MKQYWIAKLVVAAAVLTPLPVLAEELVTVTVKGMVCSFCAQGLKKTFKKKEEVADINVDLDAKLVTIRFHDGKSISDPEIKALINDAGYDIATIERKQG